MPDDLSQSEATPQAAHPEAHALTLFRALPDGRGRMYTAVTFPKNPWQGCERTIRMGFAVGWLAEPGPDSYGVLDVLSEQGDIVQDFGVPSARAFQRLKRKLNLQVEYTDGDPIPEETACV